MPGREFTRASVKMIFFHPNGWRKRLIPRLPDDYTVSRVCHEHAVEKTKKKPRESSVCSFFWYILWCSQNGDFPFERFNRNLAIFEIPVKVKKFFMHPSIFRFYFTHFEIWRLNIQNHFFFFQISNFILLFVKISPVKWRLSLTRCFLWGAGGLQVFAAWQRRGNDKKHVFWGKEKGPSRQPQYEGKKNSELAIFRQ